MGISSGLIQKAVEVKLSEVSDQIETKTVKMKEIFSRRLENNIARVEALPRLIGHPLYKAKMSAAAAFEKRLCCKLLHIATAIEKRVDSAPDNAIYQVGQRAVDQIRLKVDINYGKDQATQAFRDLVDRGTLEL